MRNLGPSAKIFLALTLLWFITLGLAELIYGRLELHLLLNHFHWPILDDFFKYLTHLGSGFTPLVLAVLLLLVNIRWAIFIGVSNIFAGAISQFLKRSLFSEMMRPTALLPDQLYLPPGIEFHAHNSFPSGHSATAFCLAMGLTLIIQDKKWVFPIFLLFSLTGFSRIYLSQHFAGDVAVGSLIGTICGMCTWIIVQRVKTPLLNKGILNR